MFLGQPGPALSTADELIETLNVVVAGPMADWLEGFVPMKQHVLIRFGIWEQMLAQPLPEDEALYCVTTAMMRYARSVACSNTDDIEGAKAERDAFLAARDRVPESRMLFNNSCRDILAVAEQILLGELAYREGNHDIALTVYRPTSASTQR
jgi:hypothetical protein